MNDFFASLYEGFNPVNLFYIEYFSDDLYQSGIYPTMGFSMIFITTILILLYYFLLSNFSKLYTTISWLIYMLIIAVINFILAYILAQNAIDDFYSTSEEGHTYIFSDFFQIGMVNAIYTIILGLVLSIIVKSFSVQARKTPF